LGNPAIIWPGIWPGALLYGNVQNNKHWRIEEKAEKITFVEKFANRDKG
jgi:hypothetical protein